MDNKIEQQSSKIAIFKGKHIRKSIHQGEWYFSIIDIVAVLTENPNPRRYWSNLKIQLAENEGFVQLYSKTVQLKLLTDLELVFNMLGEASTTEIAVQNDAQGFHQNKKATREGGEIAGNARLF